MMIRTRSDRGAFKATATLFGGDGLGAFGLHLLQRGEAFEFGMAEIELLVAAGTGCLKRDVVGPALARTWLPTRTAAIRTATMALVRPAARFVTRPS